MRKKGEKSKDFGPDCLFGERLRGGQGLSDWVLGKGIDCLPGGENGL